MPKTSTTQSVASEKLGTFLSMHSVLEATLSKGATTKVHNQQLADRHPFEKNRKVKRSTSD
jgi:hypothetical protein